MEIHSLDNLASGECGRLVHIESDSYMHHRLSALGISGEPIVKCVVKEKSGDVAAYEIRGNVIAIRKTDAKHILIQKTDDALV